MGWPAVDRAGLSNTNDFGKQPIVTAFLIDNIARLRACNFDRRLGAGGKIGSDEIRSPSHGDGR